MHTVTDHLHGRPTMPTLATPANMRRLEGAHDAGIMAFSPITLEEYSATADDYWNQPADEPLLDSEGEPMILARRVSHIVDALTGEQL